MEKIFFTPGPSQLYPTVNTHILTAIKEQILSISHRGAQFEQLVAETKTGLRRLLNIPLDYRIFFLSSASEAMERIIENCVDKYSCHLVNGAFSEKFYRLANQLGKQTQVVKVKPGLGFDLAKLKISTKNELICVTQNETSTGVMLACQEICQLKTRFSQALLAMDVVSSVPYVNLDYSKVDLVFFSVQKGFGLPAGLGILIVSPPAFAKAEFLSQKRSLGSYHDFLTLDKYNQKNQTPETPNVLGIYLLKQVVGDMYRYGIEKIRRETDQKAQLLYEFLATSAVYSSAVKDSQLQSPTTITVNVNNSPELIHNLAKKRLVVGTGYGSFKSTQIRIANFPAHSFTQVKNLINAIKKSS